MNDTVKKIRILKDKIKEISQKDISIMEVCGTHTMSVARFAIKSLLPDNINVISGPGCPVCVTSGTDIETALTMARDESKIVCTFGDMIKVPSQGDNLGNYKNVKIVYSPLDSLKIAKDNPDKEVVMLGIGFETTAPLIACAIKAAKQMALPNFSVISMHKTVPIAMGAILSDKDAKIDALILPGHVSAITGRKYFDFIKDYETSGVISGFEALDIMECIYLLVDLYNNEKLDVINNYSRIVSEHGNKLAMDTMYDVFETCDSGWRGIGTIPDSGLEIKDEYAAFNARKKFGINVSEVLDPPGCRCGEILMAKAKPSDCGLFGKNCTPANPVGPCMVSSEGTCAAFYKYQ
ncbi:MAG: hydrogenase formation protein HypD [Bacteriovoracaceae bacterium]|nr:hydrogenase formation protein HypD [Bacteriovoracaceae bacterium]